MGGCSGDFFSNCCGSVGSCVLSDHFSFGAGFSYFFSVNFMAGHFVTVHLVIVFFVADIFCNTYRCSWFVLNSCHFFNSGIMSHYKGVALFVFVSFEVVAFSQ